MTKRFEPEALIGALADHEVEFILIGGLAAIARQSPYMTTDMDICPARDEANVEKLVGALSSLGARRITDLDPEGERVDLTVDYLLGENELAFMTESGRLDIIFVPQGTQGYPDLKRGATVESVYGRTLLIPSTIDVIRMKDARGMPKDRLVVEVLRRVLDHEARRDREA